ncbi:PPC domain-containing DNA-binding protein [Haloarcula salina]|uniref:DNA-binding protein n=1 Tax=Haloarcula salina TaxID=1429914 RepID=A0AA41G568_9EURY|nr:PPC domain-containing DNA-binding protein [Haloarcula salina]MBV0903719.1 DNA-binding protein [Haloarcula salina]
MEYTRESDRVVVRLDPQDEVIESLRSLRNELQIDGGFMFGIGAVDRAILGHYDVDEQSYSEETFTGQFEVTSFSGNIGPDKIHAHIELGTESYDTLGGHCSEARVSGTFEIVVFTGETTLTHELDSRTGLDVFALDN